jgi:hypothetical protein
MSEISDDDLFFEWKELFTRYRSFGSLSEKERARFRELSGEMQKRGLIKKPSPEKIKELLNPY